MQTYAPYMYSMLIVDPCYHAYASTQIKLASQARGQGFDSDPGFEVPQFNPGASVTRDSESPMTEEGNGLVK